MPTEPDYRRSISSRITVDVHIHEDVVPEEHQALWSGLHASPRYIPSRFFYDEHGSRLFDDITSTPEYYPTRTERAILTDNAKQIVHLTDVRELLELGSGMATKTRVLLDAMSEAGRLERYLPFDVSEEIVLEVSEQLTRRYPELAVHAIVGDFNRDLALVPEGHHRLIAFLGGTIGNFPIQEAETFLSELSQQMDAGDHLLLGTDLRKDRTRLEAAYNDAAGVTDAFNRNILRVVNTKLGSNFDPTAFSHKAFYNEDRHRIEMWLVSERRQAVWLHALDKTIYLDAGEEILTELSVKYDKPSVTKLLEVSGFELEHWFTDADELFALSLARRR